jgi:hypothetical protein
MSKDDEKQALANDVCWGTQEIADEIGKSLTETQYLIRKGLLPVGRLGPKLIFALRSQLKRALTPTS